MDSVMIWLTAPFRPTPGPHSAGPHYRQGVVRRARMRARAATPRARPRLDPDFMRVLASPASMLSYRVATLLALFIVWLTPPAHAEEARVTILHTADLHGALTSWDYLADRPAARGLAKVATLVGQVRAEGAPVLLLDSGDAIQGSPLTTIW